MGQPYAAEPNWNGTWAIGRGRRATEPGEPFFGPSGGVRERIRMRWKIEGPFLRVLPYCMIGTNCARRSIFEIPRSGNIYRGSESPRLQEKRRETRAITRRTR